MWEWERCIFIYIKSERDRESEWESEVEHRTDVGAAIKVLVSSQQQWAFFWETQPLLITFSTGDSEKP